MHLGEVYCEMYLAINARTKLYFQQTDINSTSISFVRYTNKEISELVHVPS